MKWWKGRRILWVVLTRRRLSDNRLSAIPGYVMGCPELSSFSRAYTAYTWRYGVKGRRTLLKNVVHGALRFWEGVSKVTFSNCSSGMEGGAATQNSTLSTLLIMLTILDNPLGKMPHKWRLAARNGWINCCRTASMVRKGAWKTLKVLQFSVCKSKPVKVLDFLPQSLKVFNFI